MLLSYGASNYFCFNEGIEIPFKLSEKCPRSISDNERVSNVLCVKGANASGKTNALKILFFLNDFCCNSFAYKPDDSLPFETFFHNDETSVFYLDFIGKKAEYRYELETSRKQVVFERLYRKVKRNMLVVERRKNKIVKTIKEFDKLKTMKIRSNASIISTAKQYEISSINPFYNFIGSIITNIGKYELFPYNFDHEITSIISEMYYREPDFFEFVKEIIYKCDVGVNDIEIKKTLNLEGKAEYSPFFKHHNNKSIHALPLTSQSSGTKSLFFELFRYKIALDNGGVLVLDEFDVKLHPHILPTLVNLFTDKETNPHNAQLIFTTHNDDIMNFMGKYRTVLLNKNDNESFGYRLDEIPGDILRNDRPISPIYNAGKVGGTPRIGQIEL